MTRPAFAAARHWEDDVKTMTSRVGSRLFGCAGLALALLALPLPRNRQPDQDRRDRRGLSVAGASLTRAAVMAADDINAHGGVSGRKLKSLRTTTIVRRRLGTRLPARGEPGQGSRCDRQLY